MELRRGLRWSGWLILLVVVMLAGCKKKPAAPPPTPPPPPAPAAPTVTLRAVPSVIERGQSTTLSWNSTNATELRIEPRVGSVGPQGSTSAQPQRSTTYTVVAEGPGGRAEASTRVTVNVPPPPPPREVRRIPLREAFEKRARDAFFDFDKSNIRPDGRIALTQTAELLREYPEARVLIEGHCDERGTTEYNIGLGSDRTNAAKQFLVSLGITAERIETVSYGKEKPFCFESTEECWQTNRRAHFILLSR
ncbi:peptidoglycan-associated lipoprotein Pal [Acidobacteriia bacterium AH_259_A11_L15]|nr:peptidoglycan-associated lipoprotein Pal [Acidobacteriia bacterium AH_259_A11_L15]